MTQAHVLSFIDDLEYRDYNAGEVVDFPDTLLGWLKSRKLVDDTPSVVAAAIAGGAVQRTHSKGSAPGSSTVSAGGGSGGGPLTARRALARKLSSLTHRKFWNDKGGHEVMRLPPAYAAGQMYQGEARLSTDGKTIWLCTKSGNSSAEPTRDANYPYKEVLDAGGAAIWAPFDAETFPLTKKDSLRATGGAIALPAVSHVGAGQAAPNINGTVLTERYNYRKAVESLAPTTWESYQLTNHNKIDSPATWNATDRNDSGGYASSVNVVGGVVSAITPDTATCFRFFTKAKQVSITLPGRTGQAVGETSIANGNIVVDGVALEPFSARGAAVTNAAWQQRYDWEFADEVEREFVVFGDGGWPQAIYTSSAHDIFARPQDVVRAVFFSDSTGSGAGPGPYGFVGGKWGDAAMSYIGAMAGSTNAATGGIGYLSRPLSPKTASASNKALNVYDKLRFNQQYWDIAQNGGKKIDIWLLDQVGWDVGTSATRYDAENGAYTFVDGGGAETWSIDSTQRKAKFREILRTMLAYQPDAIFVTVVPRTNVLMSTPTSNARGYWNVDPKATADSVRTLFGPMADDWFDALQEIVPADQLCYISLAGFEEHLDNRTAQWSLSVPQADFVHPTTRYHHLKGIYVGQQILRWLSLS